MRRGYNLLASLTALVLTPVLVDAAPPAQIAFSSDRDGNFEIYVMDADRKNQRRLTNNRHDDWDPSWSPGGKRIAFTSSGKVQNVVQAHPLFVVGGPPQIYVMDNNGGNKRRLTNSDFAEWYPSWSPDGERIAFTSSGAMDTAGWYIYVVDANGKNLRRLTHPDSGWYPSWSPDSKRIAFVSSRNAFGNEIYVMNADGSNQQRLTETPHDNIQPSWSPDGERIAFVSSRDGNFEIYMMNADGKNQRRLTRTPAHDWHPSWSPDGKRVVFVSHRDGNYEIYTMNVNGARQVRRLTKEGSDDTDPTWFDPAFAIEIVPFSVSAAGKKITMWGWLKQVNQ